MREVVGRWSARLFLYVAVTGGVIFSHRAAATDFSALSFAGVRFAPYTDGAGARGTDTYIGNHLAWPSERCSFESITELIKTMSEQGVPPAEQATRLENDWLAHCSEELETDTEGMWAVLRTLEVRYDLRQNPQVSRVHIDLPGGVRLRGLLGLKEGRARPLLIANCGLHCNAGGLGANDVFMRLFDEAPFNLLLIGSVTGTEYAEDNRVATFGGWLEGLYMAQAAQLLQAPQSTIKDRISEIHYFGFSLGGQAALYAGLYGQQNAEFADPQSVMVGCPVINLEPAIDRIFSRGGDNIILNQVLINDVARALRAALGWVPIIGQLIPRDERGHPNWDPDNMRTVMVQSALQNYKNLTSEQPWPWAPFVGERIQSVADLWRVNNFFNYLDQYRDVPTNILYAINDDIVLPNEQARRLQNEAAARNMTSIGAIRFSEGHHCAMGMTHGWNTYSALLRHLVLSQSPARDEFWLKQSFPFNGRVLSQRAMSSPRSKIYNYHFIARANSPELQVHFREYRNQGRCNADRRQFNTRPGQAQCEEFTMFSVNWPLRELGLATPNSEFAANRLSRWLNTNVILLDEQGQTIRWQRREPAQFVLQGQYEF